MGRSSCSGSVGTRSPPCPRTTPRPGSTWDTRRPSIGRRGITVDTARVIAHQGMTRQQLYAAMSRGREENHAHVEVETQLDVDVERAPHARADGAVVLAQIIARDGA